MTDPELLQQIAGDVAETKNAVATIKADVSSLKKTVEGNGREPLDVRVARLETVRATVRYGVTTCIALLGVMATVAGVVWAIWSWTKG